jgi:hypothetical protein
MPRIMRTIEHLEFDIKTQTKICRVCGIRKNFNEYFKSKNKKDGIGYRCKPCDNLAKKQWMTNNPEKCRKGQRREVLKRKYGLTENDYLTMLDKQKGVCAICNATESSNKTSGNWASLAVDHCHTTGKIRGLLCNRCNRSLGFFEDSLDLLLKAMIYLSR